MRSRAVAPLGIVIGGRPRVDSVSQTLPGLIEEAGPEYAEGGALAAYYKDGTILEKIWLGTGPGAQTYDDAHAVLEAVIWDFDARRLPGQLCEGKEGDESWIAAIHNDGTFIAKVVPGRGRLREEIITDLADRLRAYDQRRGSAPIAHRADLAGLKLVRGE